MSTFDIIIVEGADKVGKTTFKKELERITNYKYIFIDRMYSSAVVYEKLKKRGNDIEAYREDFKRLCEHFDVLLIFLFPRDIGDIERKIKELGDDIVDVNEVLNLYILYRNEFRSIKMDKVKKDLPIAGLVSYIVDVDGNTIELARKAKEDFNL